MRSRLDLSEKVENKDRRFGAATEYYPAVIVHGSRQMPALFTPADISQAMQRADANPEDMPELRRSFWHRIIAWWTV